jgi:hypothetical protein
MVADTILEEFTSFIGFANAGFKYNLQVFPDTITAAAMLFAVLFQSAPFGALSGSLVLLRFLHPVVASFFGSVLSGNTGPGTTENCSGMFPGASFERLIGAASQSKFSSLSSNSWPSFYSTFLGFLTGYIGLLPIVYHQELAASSRRQAATISGLIILAIVVIVGIVFRSTSSCDDGVGIAVGIFAGFIVGAIIMAFLAWISERRITNILGFPLIRSKTADGKPIYVCQKAPEKNA